MIYQLDSLRYQSNAEISKEFIYQSINYSRRSQGVNLTLHHSLIIGVPIKGNNSWCMSFKSFQHWCKLSLYKISMHGECYKLTEEFSYDHIKPIYMEKVKNSA